MITTYHQHRMGIIQFPTQETCFAQQLKAIQQVEYE